MIHTANSTQNSVKNFTILGGDMRQIYLASELNKDGFEVKVYGFDDKIVKKNGLIPSESLELSCKNSDVVILPLPTTVDKMTINTPLLTDNSKKIKIGENFFKLLQNRQIFCGQFTNFKDSNDSWKTLNVKDYYENEEFALSNAVPTAEAALAIGILESKITIKNSNCLVAGFGKVGEAMALSLKNNGANVTIFSRTKSKCARIKMLGYDYLEMKHSQNLTKFDIIYNSVPHIIFDDSTLKNCRNDALIIDLASKPGGVDFEAAKSLGIKTIHALALPGKYSPKTAANITKQIILGML